MIVFLSNIISDFLCKKGIISSEEKEIYSYGYQIAISTVIGITIVFFIGLFAQQLLETLVFYIVFVVTRQYCGGYHAKTYLKCNITFTLIYISILVFSNMFLDYYNIMYHIVFLSFYMVTILCLAPIDHENKRLTASEKKKYKLISVILSIIWCIVSVIFYVIYFKLTIITTMTLLWIAMLMVIEKTKRKETEL